MAAADSSCYPCVHDSMDQLWFYQNILAFEPHVVRLQSMLTRPKSVMVADSVSRPKSSDENTNRQVTSYSSDKRPLRLNIVVGQPLFQLPSSSSSTNTTSHPAVWKRKPRVKRYRSLSELEKYELKGFMDLGFTFHKDKLSSYMMSMVPGLQRLGQEDGEHYDDDHGEREVRRPYLSEAWLANNPGSSLHGLQMLPKNRDGADMKKHIKYWAKTVAALVHEGDSEIVNLEK